MSDAITAVIEAAKTAVSQAREALDYVTAKLGELSTAVVAKKAEECPAPCCKEGETCDTACTSSCDCKEEQAPVTATEPVVIPIGADPVVIASDYSYPGTNGGAITLENPDGWVKEWPSVDVPKNFELKVKFRVDGEPRVGGSVSLLYLTQTGGCCGTPGDAVAGIFVQQDIPEKLWLCIVVGTNASNQLCYLDPRTYEDPDKVFFSYGEEMTVVIKAVDNSVKVSYRDFEAEIAAYAPGEERVGGPTKVYTPGPPFVPITGVLHEATLVAL